MHVLLVDDTADNRHILERFLRADGHSVRVVASGEEALDVLRETAFDIVLLDIMMPGLDGYETLAALRERSPEGPPVLALTARLFPEDIEKCAQAGFAAHVAKPVTRQSLREALAPFRPAAADDTSDDRAAVAVSSQDAVQSAVDALRPNYLARRREDLDTLKAALGGGDLAAVRRIAHRIAGSAATYGFAALTDAARDVEAAADAEDAFGTGEALRRLAELLARELDGSPA